VTAPTAVSVNSIAVLLFDNMSGDANQDYFCDGISEEILNARAPAGPESHSADSLFVFGR
jgi:TolB-like protein